MTAPQRTLLVLIGLHAQPLIAQRLQLRQGVFGFANAEGTELLALDSVSNPTQIRGAVCAGARVYRVAYARRQSRQPAGNGRQVAANFRNEAGDVFRLVGGTPRGDETCYLSADSSLMASAVPADGPVSSGCDRARLSRIAQAKRRSVIHCWPLASAGPGAHILAVQFSVVDTNALASVVLIDQDHLLFQDFPGTYRGPQSDIWRADDGGLVSPDGFGIPFLCRLRGTYVIALTWAGTEGEDSYLLVADSGNVFRSVATSYRYWVPE